MDLGIFFFCCYFLIEALAQTGFLSNMNLFVLVSEGENNFGLLNSRDPNKTFLWITIKLLIRSDILGPPLLGHQCCMDHWESMKLYRSLERTIYCLTSTRLWVYHLPRNKHYFFWLLCFSCWEVRMFCGFCFSFKKKQWRKITRVIKYELQHRLNCGLYKLGYHPGLAFERSWGASATILWWSLGLSLEMSTEAADSF